MRTSITLILLNSFMLNAQSKLLINMDLQQTNHLKAHGITFNALKQGVTADWLLNYHGGSFLLDYSEKLALQCRIKSISFETLSGAQAADIYAYVQNEEQNMEDIRLEKAPEIAVYETTTAAPGNDAVTLVLEYE